MPTTRRRHLITETDRIADVLDDAAKRWPEEDNHRARLLVRLVEEGHRALTGRQEQEESRRRDAVACTSGSLSGVYGEGYLRRLRKDWPG